MKKLLLTSLFLILLYKFSLAQNDTIYYYYSRDAKETTRDSAFYYKKLYRQDNQWFGREYYKKGNIVKSEGNYAGKDGNSPVSSFKNYKENGILSHTSEYDNGKLRSSIYFYKNGNKKSEIIYNNTSSDQKGWDENGKEIRNYVVEKEARFKGGSEGWKKYLQKNLNAMAAADANAPEGTYEVKVQFIITKEGYVSKVKAISIPAACKPCAGEAVSVISNSPAWEPAVQNDEPVVYQAIQFVSFQVADQGKKGKKR